jgi:hypothetical protein
MSVWLQYPSVVILIAKTTFLINLLMTSTGTEMCMLLRENRRESQDGTNIEISFLSEIPVPWAFSISAAERRPDHAQHGRKVENRTQGSDVSVRKSEAGGVLMMRGNGR